MVKKLATKLKLPQHHAKQIWILGMVLLSVTECDYNFKANKANKTTDQECKALWASAMCDSVLNF